MLNYVIWRGGEVKSETSAEFPLQIWKTNRKKHRFFHLTLTDFNPRRFFSNSSIIKTSIISSSQQDNYWRILMLSSNKSFLIICYNLSTLMTFMRNICVIRCTSTDKFDNHAFNCHNKFGKIPNEPYFKLYVFMVLSNYEKLRNYERKLHSEGHILLIF